MKYLVTKEPLESSENGLRNLACEQRQLCATCPFADFNNRKCNIKETPVENIIEFLENYGYDIESEEEEEK